MANDYTVSQDIDQFLRSANDTTARAQLGLGTAATSDSSAFATSAQGTLATTALQDASAFATSTQGTLASTALQSGDNISELSNNAGYITSAPVDSINFQTGSVILDADDINDSSTTHKFASTNDLILANSALQSGADISELNNNSGYITSAPVDSVNTLTGVVILDADDINDFSTTHKFATQAQLNNADSALQSGDNISELNNDSGYLTTALQTTDIDTLSELNAILTDANLDDASSSRPPTAHGHANWYVSKMGTETDDASGTGEKTAWIAPASGEITGVHSGSSTVTAGGSLTVDVKKNAVSILSTLGVIASGDDSTTTGTAHALTTSPTSFSAGDRISFDINTFGGTGAKGLHTDLLIQWD